MPVAAGNGEAWRRRAVPHAYAERRARDHLADCDDDIQGRVKLAVEDAGTQLVRLGRHIHAHPELRFEEHQAPGWASALLEDRGFVVGRCFDAGALATGCTVEIRRTAPVYSHIEADKALSRLYGENARALGRHRFEMPPGMRRGAMSTDMANVSLAVPAIHPSFGVPGATLAPHHQAFAAACATPESDETVMLVATALAWTGVDAATDRETRERLLRGERMV